MNSNEAATGFSEEEAGSLCFLLLPASWYSGAETGRQAPLISAMRWFSRNKPYWRDNQDTYSGLCTAGNIRKKHFSRTGCMGAEWDRCLFTGKTSPLCRKLSNVARTGAFLRSARFTVIFILVYWLYYERIMFAEEQFLRRKFGEKYDEYSSKVYPLFRLNLISFPGTSLFSQECTEKGISQLCQYLPDFCSPWYFQELLPYRKAVYYRYLDMAHMRSRNYLADNPAHP